MSARNLEKVALLVILALGALIAGCSGGEEVSPDTVVAKVGDREITIADFEDFSSRVGPEFLPENQDLQGKKEFLETIINKELMAIKADQLGYDKDPSLLSGQEHFKKGAMISRYYQMRAREPAAQQVTEEAARREYRRLGIEVDIRQIVSFTREDAQELRERILAGEDMGELARRYSKSNRASEGGVWKNLKYATTVVEFEDAVFELQPGEVSEPFETQYGWNIVKVLKRRTTDVGSWEENKEYCFRLARGRIEGRLINELRKNLLERNNFNIDPEVRRIVYNALPPDVPYDQAPTRNDEVHPILKFEDEDLKKVLCTFNDESWTVEYFSDLYDKTAFVRRPRREHNLLGIDHYIISMIIDRFIVRDALEKGLDEDPQVVRTVKNKEEEIMVSIMHQQLIESEIDILPEELQTYYEENREAYYSSERRNFRVVLVKDEETAESVYELARQGRSFVDLVLQYSLDDASKEYNGETSWLQRGQNPPLDIGFDLENIGDVSEPFEIPGRGWAVLQLIDVEEDRQLTFEEAEPVVRRDLKTIKANEKLEEYLERWKEEIEITVYDDKLEKARFVERPAI